MHYNKCHTKLTPKHRCKYFNNLFYVVLKPIKGISKVNNLELTALPHKTMFDIIFFRLPSRDDVLMLMRDVQYNVLSNNASQPPLIVVVRVANISRHP